MSSSYFCISMKWPTNLLFLSETSLFFQLGITITKSAWSVNLVVESWVKLQSKCNWFIEIFQKFPKMIFCSFSRRTAIFRTHILSSALKFWWELSFTPLTLPEWKVSKYQVIPRPNTGKYRPEISLYLDTFHAVT